jgi:peroxiredoxin
MQNGIYSATTGIKFLTRTDTVFVTGTVRFEKHPRDTAFGCRFDITAGQERLIYDGRILTTAYLQDSLKIIHDRWLYPIPVKKKMPLRLLHDYWSGNTRFLKEWIENISIKMVPLADTVLFGTECHRVSVVLPDESTTEEHRQVLFISKNDFFLLGQTVSYFSLNKPYYRSWFIHNIEINLARPDRNYSSDLIPKSFYTKRYVPEEIERLLKVGSPAPSFRLKDPNNRWFHSSEASGKLMVLYFWHMLSPQARTLLNMMENLHRDFESAGVVVLGMNVEESDPEGLKKYLRRKNITFRQLIQARITAMKYNVNDIPAFYVIGRNGTVLDAFYDLNNAAQRLTEVLKRDMN